MRFITDVNKVIRSTLRYRKKISYDIHNMLNSIQYEGMKIKKEVFSAITGKVLKIHVRDGDVVEYGQELFTVEPRESGT